jgi:hypothetical protein
MKTKTFDCVEMKRRGGRAVYEAVKGMTVEQELAYWQTKTEELRSKIGRKPRLRRTA